MAFQARARDRGGIKIEILISYGIYVQKCALNDVDEGSGRTVVYCTALIVFVKECIFMCIVGGYWSAVDRDRLLAGDGCGCSV